MEPDTGSEQIRKNGCGGDVVAVLTGANITVRVTNNDCLETAGDRRI